MFWHKFKRSKKAKQYQNLEQQEVQMTQPQPQNPQEQSQRTQQQPQDVQQQPQKAQPALVQTEHVVQSKPKSKPSSSSHRNSRHVYANYPAYVEQPSTVYYVVQQPNTVYVQQRPQYVVQDPYYARSNFIDNALLFGTGLLIGDLLF